MDYTVHEILQARILEWVAIPFSRNLCNPGIEPRSPTLQADSLPSEPPGKLQSHRFTDVFTHLVNYSNKKLTTYYVADMVKGTERQFKYIFLNVLEDSSALYTTF